MSRYYEWLANRNPQLVTDTIQEIIRRNPDVLLEGPMMDIASWWKGQPSQGARVTIKQKPAIVTVMTVQPVLTVKMPDGRTVQTSVNKMHNLRQTRDGSKEIYPGMQVKMEMDPKPATVVRWDGDQSVVRFDDQPNQDVVVKSKDIERGKFEKTFNKIKLAGALAALMPVGAASNLKTAADIGTGGLKPSAIVKMTQDPMKIVKPPLAPGDMPKPNQDEDAVMKDLKFADDRRKKQIKDEQDWERQNQNRLGGLVGGTGGKPVATTTVQA